MLPHAPAVERAPAARDWLKLGLRAAAWPLSQRNRVWSRYSNEKPDVAGCLARVIRTLSKALPIDQPLTALSIGSSTEPQFRVLESACRGGVYLLDAEDAALATLAERSRRQCIAHVRPVRGDYRQVFRDEPATDAFRHEALDRRRMTLVTLHHSLYYSPRSFWPGLITRLYGQLLEGDGGAGPSAAIHAVLMASRDEDPTSTTGLYNHFAGRFFGCRNDQDLAECAGELRTAPELATSQVLTRSTRVEFTAPDFEQFMAVVWMVLLHPHVHEFSPEQQREVVEFVYDRLWSRGLPLVQVQDHMVIYRDRGVAGLI